MHQLPCQRSLPLACALLSGCFAPTVASSAAGVREHSFDCLIKAPATVKVGAPAAGLISSVLVGRGDLVFEGQVLAELESIVERAAVELAEARASSDVAGKSNLARVALLRRKISREEQPVVSSTAVNDARIESKIAELDALETELQQRVTRLKLALAQEVLRQRRVTSPIDGVVMERALSAGEYRHEQAHIFTIAQISPLHVEVDVPIAFYRQVRVGNHATIFPKQPIGGAYPGEVSVVDRVLDPIRGTFGVRLTLNNDNLELPAGLRCTVRFNLHPENALGATFLDPAAEEQATSGARPANLAEPPARAHSAISKPSAEPKEAQSVAADQRLAGAIAKAAMSNSAPKYAAYFDRYPDQKSAAAGLASKRTIYAPYLGARTLTYRRQGSAWRLRAAGLDHSTAQTICQRARSSGAACDVGPN